MARELKAPDGWIQPDCQEWFYKFDAVVTSLKAKVEDYARGSDFIPSEQDFRDATTMISEVRKIMKEARKEK